jgi:hypothetical protein
MTLNSGIRAKPFASPVTSGACSMTAAVAIKRSMWDAALALPLELSEQSGVRRWESLVRIGELEGRAECDDLGALTVGSLRDLGPSVELAGDVHGDPQFLVAQTCEQVVGRAGAVNGSVLAERPLETTCRRESQGGGFGEILSPTLDLPFKRF